MCIALIFRSMIGFLRSVKCYLIDQTVIVRETEFLVHIIGLTQLGS